MANQTHSNSSLRPLLDKDKLNGVNFLDWDRNLRIVLKHERKEYVLDNAIPEEPAASTPRATRDAFQKHLSDSIDVACIMLGCMEGDLQKQFMELSDNPYLIMNQIKEMVKKGNSFNKPTAKGSKAPSHLAGKMRIPVTPKPPRTSAGKWKAKEKTAVCFYCQEAGHWERNCKKFQDDQWKSGGSTSSGIYVIELNLST